MGAATPDGDAACSGLDDDADGVEPLIFFKRGGFAGGSAGHEKVDA